MTPPRRVRVGKGRVRRSAGELYASEEASYLRGKGNTVNITSPYFSIAIDQGTMLFWGVVVVIVAGFWLLGTFRK